MPEQITQKINKFAARLKRCESEITARFVEEICASRRADLLSTLTYEQLVGYVPELLAELARALETDAGAKQVARQARNIRDYAQTRFQQNCLIDEALRELMILRGIVNEVVWDDADKKLDGMKARPQLQRQRDESDSETQSDFDAQRVKRKEGSVSVATDIYEIRDTLQRTQRFFDEIIWQTVMIYAASQRPPVPTRTASWHLPLQRKESEDLRTE